MTLDGFYFTATGISEYAFFNGSECVCSVSHIPLPDAPLHIRSDGEAGGADGRAWTFSGDARAYRDESGAAVAELYVWDARRFAIATPDIALNGRILFRRMRSAVLFTGLDDEVLVRIEYDFDRYQSRERFGEWFPRRYVATVKDGLDRDLAALALAAPFLYVEGLEVG